MSGLPLYVIIISEHNLAELRACLRYRPQRLWMVVTPAMRRQAERFARVLAPLLPETAIHQFGLEDETPLSGIFVDNVLAWSCHHFLPRLQDDPDAGAAVLNMTGGTKALSFTLAQTYPWAELHYQPHQTVGSHLERYLLEAGGKVRVLERVNLSGVEATPLDIARLYMDTLRVHSPNTVSVNNLSLAVALDRLEAQKHTAARGEDNSSAWAWLLPHLERIWFHEDHPASTRHVRLQRSILRTPPAELEQLLERLSALAPPGTLSWDAREVAIPTARHKPSADWRRWISGGWFEQLVEHWLLEGGVPKVNLAPNIQLKQGESQGREADMLLLHRNTLHVVELKADLPANETLGRFEEQLSSLSGTLGKVAKVLVVGPAVRRRHTAEQWLEFRLRCLDNQVNLIELEGAESLAGLMPWVRPHAA